MKSFKKISLFIEGFLLLNVFWWLASILMNTRVLPSPVTIYAALPRLFVTEIAPHITASAYRIFMGVGIATLLGIAIGIAMAYSKLLNKILNPLLYFTYPIPKTALLPILMMLFGLGDGSKITLIVLITIFQIIFGVRDAIMGIDMEMYRPLQSLGASRMNTFYHVTLPAMLPSLITNMRIAFGTALSILFFVETFGTQAGLGYYIQDAWNRINYTGMYAGILVLSFIGVLLFLALDIIENIYCAWRN